MSDRMSRSAFGAATASASVQRTPSMHSAMRSILLGGLVAGTVDIGAACLINWLSPPVILRAIASGVLGKASFHMGATSAFLGLVLQWFMSFLIAAIYVGATYLLPVLRRRWVWCGCAYGVPVYLVMNYVVMPLSAVGHAPKFVAAKAAANLLAMIWFGLVVAYFARDAGPPTREAAGAASLIGE